MKILLAVFFSLISTASEAQSRLESYVKDVRRGLRPSPKPLLENKNEHEKTMKEIEPFLSDSSRSVRHACFSLVRQMGSAAEKNEMRKKSVSLLTASLARFSGDGDAVSSALQHFHKEDFDAASLAAVCEAVSVVPNKNELMRLAGYAGDAGTVSCLKPWSVPGNPPAVRWSAWTALARLGDGEAIAEILRRVKKLPMSHELVLRVFPDLVYTRQKQIYDYLTEALNSNKEDCESADNDNPKPILCGYRIMEMLAPAIKDFPLETDAGGDLTAKDYKKALEKARKWLEKHKDFEIRKEIF